MKVLMKGLNQLAPHAHWILRVMMGGVYVYHSIVKFSMPIDKFADAMHFPVYIAVLVALAELGGGLFIFLGGFIMKDLLTKLGALFITIVMVGALVLVKFKMGWPAMEIDVVLLAVALYFLFAGNKSSKAA